MTNNPLTPYAPHRIQGFISTLDDFNRNIPHGSDLQNAVEMGLECMRYLANKNRVETNKKSHPCVNCSDGWGMETSVGFDSCHFTCGKLAEFERRLSDHNGI